jgi:hypothetical protein
VVASGDLAPVAGATVTFGDAAPLTTDARGSFAMVTSDPATQPLLISAAGFLTRETALTGGAVQSDLEFDLLAPDPMFPLQQYRDVVRNAYERPASPEPSRRWTTNPNLFIWTTWRDTGAPVNPAFVEFLIAEARRIVPAWSDGRLQLGVVETSAIERPRAKGWITVQFDHSGNWSLLGEDPGWVQFAGDFMCQSIAIAHEFGHAMGYWHTRVRPSIMGGAPGSCAPTELSTAERQIARALYARAPGNVEPDKDGPAAPPASYTHASAIGSSRSPLVLRCDALLRR